MPITEAQHGERVEEHWDSVDPSLLDAEQSIVVKFRDWPTATNDLVWERMFALELAAGEALLEAGVGNLDGNGSDGEIYQVFFWGVDCDEMWSLIEPIYSQAPLAWSDVEGWESLEDEAPTLELTR